MNLVSDTANRVRWAIGLNGALSVAFGAMILIWPGIGLYALTILFGAYSRYNYAQGHMMHFAADRGTGRLDRPRSKNHSPATRRCPAFWE